MHPRNVCIVRLSAIGDIVHTLPLAGALKRAWPEVRITWVAQPVPGLVLKESPFVDEILPFRRRSGAAAIREYLGFRGGVRSRRWDLVLDPQVALKAGVLTALLGAPVKLGFDFRRASDLNWVFTNRRIPRGPRAHVVDETLEFATALGAPARPVEWGLRFSAQEREAQERFFASIEPPVCGVVVGTTHPDKNWPAERWVPVVDALHERWGFQVLLLGGPSPVERAIADQILRDTRTDPIDALGDDLRRMMWLVGGVDLLVSPDTGPLHIGVALGTPVLGLFGRTNPARSGPYGLPRDRVVDGYARFPGEAYGMDTGYRKGMTRITPEAVISGVARLLDPPPARG